MDAAAPLPRHAAPARSSPAGPRDWASPSPSAWWPRAAPGWCSPAATRRRAGRRRRGCAGRGARSASSPAISAASRTASALVDAAGARMGGANALVNAAAICDRGGLLDTTPEIWARLMDVNARGPFFAMQRFAAQAIARGEPAAVVNILSMAIHCGQSYLAPYAASKAALAALTRNLAHAHRRDRIRFNGIACGWMDTPGEDATQRRWHGAGDDWLAKAEARAAVRATRQAGRGGGARRLPAGARGGGDDRRRHRLRPERGGRLSGIAPRDSAKRGKMTVRFGLLGAGRIGKVHARAITGDPRRLVAVADAMAPAARRSGGAVRRRSARDRRDRGGRRHRRGGDLHPDRHPRRPDRALRAGRQGDLLREADRPRPRRGCRPASRPSRPPARS